MAVLSCGIPKTASKQVGYVWLQKEYSSPGIELEIHSIDGTLKGFTSEIPFMDVKKKTPSVKLSS